MKFAKLNFVVHLQKAITALILQQAVLNLLSISVNKMACQTL